MVFIYGAECQLGQGYDSEIGYLSTPSDKTVESHDDKWDYWSSLSFEVRF